MFVKRGGERESEIREQDVERETREHRDRKWEIREKEKKLRRCV